MASTAGQTTTALTADQLHRRFTADEIAQVRRPDQDPPPAPIGQARALEALRLGLALDGPGFNVFVCGPAGTGKMSTVRTVLRDEVRAASPLRDLAFVHNFEDPDRPKIIELTPGGGRRLRRAIEGFVDTLSERVGKALEQGSVDDERRRLMAECETLEGEELEAFDERCRKQRFALVRLQLGEMEQLDVLPIYKREPIDMEELNDLAQEGRARVPKLAELNRLHPQLKEELRQIIQKLRACALRARDAIEDLERGAVRAALADPIEALSARFPDTEVGPWLTGAADWLAEHHGALDSDADEFVYVKRMLRVNVVLDNHGRTEPPVIFETTPTFANLLGTVEQPAGEARQTLDFGDIKGGSLLRADGGVLVLNADHAVQQEGVWRTLSRALRTRVLEIQAPEQVLSPVGGSALKPQPIALRVKVIAVGSGGLYSVLHQSTDDFRRVFKIKAEFDAVLPHDDSTLRVYVDHADRVCREEGLLPAANDGLARLAEFGVRLAGRQGWLSAQFGVLTDLLREAAHYATRAGSARVERAHVEEALQARDRRHALAEDRLRDLARMGVLDVATDGEAVGEVNALTVLDLGDHAFGQPCRMSASCAPGREGLVSVERDVGLSGRIHDKATLIIEGYLRSHYLPDRAMALSATIAFEQLHDEVEGDSASIAEAVALLSALTELPVDQSVAVTGAMDQRGRVLAVGGVTEKVEGFYRLCALRGLTGRQGVIVPADNQADLTLAEDIVRAVADGQFHVWTAKHLDQVLTRLFGRTAGERDGAGRFPEGTLNAMAQAALGRLADRADPLPTTR